MRDTNDVISGGYINDIVSKLFALRAGLSIISQQADDIRNIDVDIERERNRPQAIRAEIADVNRRLAQEKDSLDKILSERQELDRNKQAEIGKIVSKETGPKGVAPQEINVPQVKRACTIIAIILAVLTVGLAIGLIITFNIDFFTGTTLSGMLFLLTLASRLTYGQKEKEAQAKVSASLVEYESKATGVRSIISSLESDIVSLSKR